MPRFDADWIEAMIGAERAAATPAEQLLDLVTVGPGERVADVGCGPGFLTLPAAQRVGEAGVVWALDAEPAMVRLVEERATAAGVGQRVRPLLVESARLPLDDGGAHVVLCSLVLHFFKEPEHGPEALGRFCRELKRIAAPGGRLLVVEWLPRPAPKGVPSRSNRLTPDECAVVLREAGWQTAPSVTVGSVARRAGRESVYAVVCRASR